MSPTNYIRLSELSTKITNVIQSAFKIQTFWIVADVTNHTFRAQSHYHYFDLVEKDPNSNNIIAKISGKAWGMASTYIKNFEEKTGQKFSNNINVLIQVKVTFHEVYGLSLDLIDIDTNFTLGLLEQQRQQILADLVSNNSFIQKVGDIYVTRNKLLKLPVVIQKIAVISSMNSAGIEDFKHSLENNTFGYSFSVDVYNAIVQGAANAEQFLLKLIEVFQSNKDYDAVVIVRGGGAQTDFLIFDNYFIGRAVAKFPIPIITGIGHQKNETITDLMAHTQTKTPTKAAEFIIAHNRQFEDSLVSFQNMILIKSQQMFSFHFQRLAVLQSIIVNNSRNILSSCKDFLVEINQITINTTKTILFNHRNQLLDISAGILSKPKIIIYSKLNDLENTVKNLISYNTIYLKSQASYLRHFISVIKLMSPNNILRKGFAVVKAKNSIIKNPSEIKIGEEIDVIFYDSTIKSTVNKKQIHNGTEFNL